MALLKQTILQITSHLEALHGRNLMPRLSFQTNIGAFGSLESPLEVDGFAACAGPVLVLALILVPLYSTKVDVK